MHKYNIYYYKNVNKEQVKMWHIFQIYLAENQNHALNAWYALALQGHNTDLCLKAH
jgi:hypothetical protein